MGNECVGSVRTHLEIDMKGYTNICGKSETGDGAMLTPDRDLSNNSGVSFPLPQHMLSSRKRECENKEWHILKGII